MLQSSTNGYGATDMPTTTSTPDLSASVHEEGDAASRLNRHASVGPGLDPTSFLNPRQKSRRALYSELPFYSMYGMQYRERRSAKLCFRMSYGDLKEGLREEGKAGGEQEEKEEEDEDATITFPLVAAVLGAVLLQFLLGYNTGVMNAPEAVVFPDHSTTEWSLAVSVFAIGGPFGAILAGDIANKRGRKAALILNAWIFLLGGVILTTAVSMLYIIIARVIVGFASGFASVVVPIYLGELAPPTLRGTLGTLTQFAMVIGILASNLSAFPLATPTGWRWMFGVTPIVAAIQLLGSHWIYESPKWLLTRDEGSQEARLAIKNLRGYEKDEDVQMEIDHIVHASKKQKMNSDKGSGAVWELLTDQRVRPLVIGFTVLHMGQQLGGINAVFYYSTTFFEGIIDDPLVGTALAGFVNVLGTVAALGAMDRTGRKTLLLISSGGMLANAFLLTAALLGYLPNMAAVVGVMGFTFFFEFGLGPIPWLIVAEMFDAKYVATAMSVACQINWICNFIVGIGFPYISYTMGDWSFMPFCGVLACTFLYVWLRLPETAGRTVAEVQEMVRPKKTVEGSSSSHYKNNNKNGMQYVVVNGVEDAVN